MGMFILLQWGILAWGLGWDVQQKWPCKEKVAMFGKSPWLVCCMGLHIALFSSWHIVGSPWFSFPTLLILPNWRERWLEQPNQVQADWSEIECTSKVFMRRHHLLELDMDSLPQPHPFWGPQSLFPAPLRASALNLLPRTHNNLAGALPFSLAAHAFSFLSEIQTESLFGSVSHISRKPCSPNRLAPSFFCKNPLVGIYCMLQDSPGRNIAESPGPCLQRAKFEWWGEGTKQTPSAEVNVYGKG
jgi:hypothetical protein